MEFEGELKLLSVIGEGKQHVIFEAKTEGMEEIFAYKEYKFKKTEWNKV